MHQITNNILMIRPANFGYNPETAVNNVFQYNDGAENTQAIKVNALNEFDAMAQLLRDKGINVYVVEDTAEPVKPDAIFPNNWVSFHENGLVLQYPMYSALRRSERRQDIIDALGKEFLIAKDYTFEHYEEEGMFLEGTGSMVLDRENQIVYACISERTDIRLLDKWCVLTGYRKIMFTAFDRNGIEIYHTNVMMALGVDFAIICLESIANEGERNMVIDMLQSTNKEIIEINFAQMEAFAGNMLQVQSLNGTKYLVMSKTAYNSLKEDQISKIKSFTDIITPDIPTIEKYGGGSVRCMMAEIFLPKK